MPIEILNSNPKNNDSKLIVRANPNAREIAFDVKGDYAECRLPKPDVMNGDERDLRDALTRAFDYATGRGYSVARLMLGTFAARADLDYVLSVAIETAREYLLSPAHYDFDIEIVNPLKADKGDFDPSLLAASNCACDAQFASGYYFGEDGNSLASEFNKFTRHLEKEPTLRELIRLKMAQKHIPSRSAVYTRAGVSKETFSKIMNEEGNVDLEDYKPGKRTVAALAIGLRLDIEEAEEFFHAAGYHLGTEELPDQIFRFFVGVKRNYDISQINACLLYYGYKTLGAQARGDSLNDISPE